MCQNSCHSCCCKHTCCHVAHCYHLHSTGSACCGGGSTITITNSWNTYRCCRCGHTYSISPNYYTGITWANNFGTTGSAQTNPSNTTTSGYFTVKDGNLTVMGNLTVTGNLMAANGTFSAKTESVSHSHSVRKCTCRTNEACNTGERCECRCGSTESCSACKGK
jgi:hypothetical protein